MAEKRMFSKSVISSARFLKMPNEAQNLYFHLGMNSDDDGVVEAFTVLRQTGINEDNLKILALKNFVKILDSDELVTFITDFREHNSLRADRKKDSVYKDLLLEVCPEVDLLETKERSDVNKKKSGRSTDGPLTDNGLRSVVEVSVVENRIEEGSREGQKSDHKNSVSNLTDDLIDKRAIGINAIKEIKNNLI